MDAYPFAFLPHSARWQFVALALCAIGIAMALAFNSATGALFLLAGLSAVSVTAARCVCYARATDLEPLLLRSGRDRIWKDLGYRAFLTGLHFLQPLARGWGRLKRELSAFRLRTRPEPHQTDSNRTPSVWSFRAKERAFWNETWVSAESVLTSIAAKLRLNRIIRSMALDDGWHTDHDIQIGCGRYDRLDLRVLVEEHGAGRSLIRIAERPRVIRPIIAGVALATAVAASMAMGAWAFLWPVGAVAGGAVALWVAGLASKFARMRAVVESSISEVMAEVGAEPLQPVPPEKPTVPAVTDGAQPNRQSAANTDPQSGTPPSVASETLWQLPRPRPAYIRPSGTASEGRETRCCQMLCMTRDQAASFLTPSTKGTPSMTSAIN